MDVLLSPAVLPWLIVAGSILGMLAKMGVSWVVTLASAIQVLARAIEAAGFLLPTHDEPDNTKLAAENMAYRAGPLVQAVVRNAAANADNKAKQLQRAQYTFPTGSAQRLKSKYSLWRRLLGYLLGAKLAALLGVYAWNKPINMSQF